MPGRNGIWALVLALGCGLNAQTEEAAIERLLLELTYDEYVSRDETAQKIQALGLQVLPRLHQFHHQLEGQEKPDAGLAARVANLIKDIKAEHLAALIEQGSQVRIELKAQRPNEILRAIARQSGISTREAWTWPADAAPRDFAYSGSYWGALQELSRSESTEKPGENQQFKDPHAAKGITLIRLVRFARMPDGKQFELVFYPLYEPGFHIVRSKILGVRCVWNDGRATDAEQGAFNLSWRIPASDDLKATGEFALELKLALTVAFDRSHEFPYQRTRLDFEIMPGVVLQEIYPAEKGGLNVNFRTYGSTYVDCVNVLRDFMNAVNEQSIVQLLSADGKRYDLKDPYIICPNPAIPPGGGRSNAALKNRMMILPSIEKSAADVSMVRLVRPQAAVSLELPMTIRGVSIPKE